MDHSLINQNQIRAYRIPLCDNAYDAMRNDKLSIELDEAIRVKMKNQVTKILFESRAPTREELQDSPHIQMTSKREWNPTKVRLSEIVSAVPTDLNPDLKEKMTALVPRYVAEVERYDNMLEDLPTR